MARADVKDIDMGWEAIEKELSSFKDSYILAGFQEGSETKREVKGTRIKEGGLSMPQIAAQNEFGTKDIPSRPFMRTSFDENISNIRKFVNLQYNKIYDGKTAVSSLDAIGTYMVGLIQRKIVQIRTPPNSPRTIAIKGSSNPLIDFGQMRKTVSYTVRKS